MRQLAFIIAVSSTLGLAAFAGCGSSNNSTTSSTGGGQKTTTTQSTTSSSSSGKGPTASSSSGSTTGSSTSSTSSGAGGATGTGGSMGVGGAAANFACMVPSTPPSKGSCVTGTIGDAGVELDAGIDDAGNASVTNCDPVTNAGCAGTDVCGPDANNMHYFCQPAGSPGNVAICGDCSSDQATCGAGGLCVGVSQTQFYCVQMCCTNADCGSTGKCDIMGLQNPLPSGVGICVPM
jgi:hypothetical protein